MSQPYAGYSGYPSGAWAGYHAGYGTGYPSYDYGSYYQQQAQQSYDPNYAAWYAQQQQQQQQQAAAGSHAGVAPPPPPESEPPPLPSEAPPPLPPGEAPGQGEEPKAAASTPAATTPASTNSTSTAAPQAQQQQQQQYASYYQGQQYDASAYGGGYGYGAYGAQAYEQQPPNFASSYSYSGQYGTPSAFNSYASQVHQASSSNPNPALSSATSAAAVASKQSATPAAMNDYSRMPPPASLAPSNNARAYGGASASSAATGSNATPIGTAGAASGAAVPTSLDAMRAAAAAVASRLTAGGGQAQPQYVSVGTAATTRPAGSSAVADASKDLPTSLQQYVARALALLGRTNETRLELRTVLRDVIAQHKKEGTLWSTDWDREPLPALASQAHLSSAVEPASRQQEQQQRNGGVWDRLGGRDGSGQQQQDGELHSSKKRNRHDRQYGGYDDSDSDRSSDSGDRYGSWGKKKRVDLQHSGGKKGGKGQQQQQQQQGKKGKKGKRQQWGADDDQWSAEEQAKHAARSARFAGGNGQQHRSNTLAAYGWDEDSMAADAAGEFIVGTCQTLEKGYFRLTRAPLPEEVRPQPVLARALSRLLGMIEAKQDKYLYYNDQFKAMRQDLTVQGIKNKFTVQVYEAHARAALEYGDGAEYNQCQTQLAILYTMGLPGSHAEFGAYRLLYQSVHAAAGEGRKLLGTMRQLLGNKVGQVADSPEVEHAMQVRQALASANVSRFFHLYANAPRLGRCLMDVAVKQLRWKALNTLVRAHKPGLLPLGFLATSLGFLRVLQDGSASPEDQAGAGTAAASKTAGAGAGSSAAGRGGSVGPLQQQMSGLTVDEQGRLLPGCSERSCVGENAAAEDQQEGLAACLDWCQRHGAVFDDETDLSNCCLVTKDCWSKLFVPQDTTKVAHGDANLDIRDFLAL